MGGGLLHRTRGACVAILALAAAGAADVPAAQAITNGQADEGRHPYVGALVTHDGRYRKKRLICTGTLVSPTVFVTAAHCLLDEPQRLYVSFDEWVGAPDVGPEVSLHIGTASGHPEYTDSALPGDTHDIGVVQLDQPVDIVHGELPAPDALTLRERAGTLATTSYELVGYGREGKDRKGFYGGGGRRFAFGGFRALEAFKLVTDQTGAFGGSCNGDSGGPVLLGSTRTVLSIVSDGDPECADHGINLRLDTESARAFLDDFMAVPPPGATPSPSSPGPRPRSMDGTPTGTSDSSGAGFEPAAATAVAARFAVSRRGARVRLLRATNLAAGTTATLRCIPVQRGGCPFGVRRFAGRQNLDLRRVFGRARLPAGTRLELRLSAPERSSRIVRWRVRSGRVARTDACGRPSGSGTAGC